MTDSLLGADAVEWLGTHYTTLLSAAQSDGSLSVIDSVAPPNSGPPRHIHHDADETFVTLTGDAEFWIEGDILSAARCRSLCATRQILHISHRQQYAIAPSGDSDTGWF
uniref:hypothetical protein n=1 Tax=Pararhizobium sp. IMCC3301 TaxID=3067904 RepID=UPI0027409D69|nr:hypothetical protein [Pararhizobium sp. IMCC3301]